MLAVNREEQTVLRWFLEVFRKDSRIGHSAKST